VEKLNDAIESGTRDQNSDALVSELNSHFEKCQQLLNSISGSLGSKTMTVDGQKRNLEESEQLLQQRRELIVEYRRSIEELVKIEP
jgi:DNA repair ATPase RecN